MRRLSFVTAALFVSMVSFAGKVTEKQALQKAQYFMQGKQFKHKNLRRAPGKEPMLSLKTLQKNLPSIDWKKGSSGILLPKDVEEALDALWNGE